MNQYLLDRHAQRSVRALDGFHASSHSFLVMEDSGLSMANVLASVRREGVMFAPLEVQSLGKQLLEALSELHSLDVAHCDIKPSNVVMKEGSGNIRWELKLADFGMSEMCGRGRKNSEAWHLEIASLPYRAVEVLLGDTSYGASVDLWAAGCCLYELASSGKPLFQLSSGSEVELIMKICLQFGADESKYLRSLPHAKEDFDKYPKKCAPFAPGVLAALGEFGGQVLDGLFTLNPKLRYTAETALTVVSATWKTETTQNAKPDAAPPRTILEPCSDPGFEIWKDAASCDGSHVGERGPFAFIMGRLQPDVLGYLQGDEFIHTSEEILTRLELDTFEPPTRKENQDWHCRPKVGKKLQLNGRAGECSSSRMNGRSLVKQLVLKRSAAWRVAWGKKNTDKLKKLQRQIKERMVALPGPMSKNRMLARDADVLKTACTAGEVFITQADGELEEEDHCDGSGGTLHTGLTLYGDRLLEVRREGSEPVFVRQEPGTLWLTNSVAFRHKAIHVPSEPQNLFDLGVLKGLSLSVMLRSCYLPEENSRLAGRCPSPQDVYHALNGAIVRWLRDVGPSLVLPSLEDVQAEHAAIMASSGHRL